MQVEALRCPMCSARPQPVRALDTLIWDLIDQRGLSEDAEAVISAVWAGRGAPVGPEDIFTSMYAHDPDGGPTYARMYAALRQALAELSTVLRDTGIEVIDCGRGMGWRLRFEAGGAYVQ